jgi:hypothetical protein
MANTEHDICETCGSEALETRSLVEYERGPVTSYLRKCQDPACGAEKTWALDGDRTRER